MPHFLNHHIAHHHPHLSEMHELYISLSLRSLAIGIGGLFVPLYLYDIGFSLVMIAGFYIFAMMMRMPLELFSAFLIMKIGSKHTLIVSYVGLFLYFVSLYMMGAYPLLWIVAATLFAFDISLFWISYHMHISSARSKKHASTQLSYTMILKRIFMALGPLIGGFIAAIYGVEWTLVAAAACLLGASYPLMMTPDVSHRIQISLKNISVPLNRGDSYAHFGWQVSGVAAAYLWPLWLFLILGEYDQIGFLISISIILGIGFTYWVGKLGDRGYNQKFIQIGAGVKFLANSLRVISDSFGLALVTNLTNDMGDNFVVGPFSEKFYEAADRGERFLYILQMSYVMAVAKLFSFIALLVFALTLSEIVALQAMFVLAAIAVPSIVWVSRRTDTEGVIA